MNLKNFLKGKIAYILLMVLAISFIILTLSVIKVNAFAIGLILVVLIVAFLIPMVFEYVQKYVYYHELEESLEKLDKKYLISELIENASFYEGQILFDTLQKANKSMNDNIAKYKQESEDYREYIETWVHEIKTPIASSKLIIENNLNETTKNINEEIDRVDNLIEQVLFYSRSNNVEKDYIIKEANVKDMVSTCMKKNARMLINAKIEVKLIDLDHIVYTDVKWIDFILNQLIANSVKYKATTIKFRTKQNENSTALIVEDNGIGIDEKDINKIFEKGFTGENGRKISKSTGLGLYLCKKLCLKLGMNIFAESKVNVGTTITIVFPKTKMYYKE